MVKQKVIIDKATRVIKRLTIDDVPEIETTEEAIEVDEPITLDGYYKLDENKQKVPATIEESTQAGVNLEENKKIRKNKQKAFMQALTDAIQEAPTGKLKDFLKALKAMQE